MSCKSITRATIVALALCLAFMQCSMAQQESTENLSLVDSHGQTVESNSEPLDDTVCMNEPKSESEPEPRNRSVLTNEPDPKSEPIDSFTQTPEQLRITARSKARQTISEPEPEPRDISVSTNEPEPEPDLESDPEPDTEPDPNPELQDSTVWTRISQWPNQYILRVKKWLKYTFRENKGHYHDHSVQFLSLKILKALQIMGLVLLLMGGDNAFRLIGMQQPPRWYNDIIVKYHATFLILLFIVLPFILADYRSLDQDNWLKFKYETFYYTNGEPFMN